MSWLTDTNILLRLVEPAHVLHPKAAGALESLFAAMQVHGISHLLTFNTGDFKRYPGITMVAPDEILNLPSTQTP
jgi:predicted nucleic acid-binding protein